MLKNVHYIDIHGGHSTASVITAFRGKFQPDWQDLNKN